MHKDQNAIRAEHLLRSRPVRNFKAEWDVEMPDGTTRHMQLTMPRGRMKQEQGTAIETSEFISDALFNPWTMGQAVIRMDLLPAPSLKEEDQAWLHAEDL